MSAIAKKPLDMRGLLLRPIVLGSASLFITQLLHTWIVVTLIQKTPYLIVLQFMASGLLGESAFAGGVATALLGLFFHLVVSVSVIGVFLMAAGRIPLLRRYPIPSAFVYGFGVFVVMNMIVVPLSAMPPLPMPTPPWLLEGILEHVLAVGLPLGFLVRQNANSDK